MATFIIVDVKSPYNVMLRRLALYDLLAISLIYNLSVNFPMTTGIDFLHRNQGTACECYNTLLSLAKKTSCVYGTRELSMISTARARKTTMTPRVQTMEKTETSPKST
uniref:Uncharacterized protein n=1 Tax=Cannabis sativa TaxID=3483 RepID=A0A803PRF4_CANSA